MPTHSLASELPGMTTVHGRRPTRVAFIQCLACAGHCSKPKATQLVSGRTVIQTQTAELTPYRHAELVWGPF